MSKPQIKKAVLAYSGGLDTSIILKWLIEEYDCEVELPLGKKENFQKLLNYTKKKILK